ncbi:hypothetical protein KKG37_00675, partial [Patescibacteria group bacterium]|nr:hypothetical protein [Patescibacteria group bacterium]
KYNIMKKYQFIKFKKYQILTLTIIAIVVFILGGLFLGVLISEGTMEIIIPLFIILLLLSIIKVVFFRKKVFIPNKFSVFFSTP